MRWEALTWEEIAGLRRKGVETCLLPDLVEWMVKQAAGELDLSQFKPAPRGASIQVRLYAEDPNKNFQPSSGILTETVFPANARIETWVERGSDIPPF